MTSALLIFFSVGILEYIFGVYLFNCPKTAYKLYAYVCFFIPPIPLFMLGWLSNLNLQNALWGIFYHACRKKDPYDPQPDVQWRHVCKVLLTSQVMALLAPFAWFITSLLRGKIIACALYGPVNATMHANVLKDETYIYSQFTGFQIMVVGVVVMLIILSIKLCCSRRSPGKGMK